MKSYYAYILLVVVIIGGLILLRNTSSTESATKTSPYDAFAECISNAGATFYGAYWCPHCQAQKKLFQNSKKLPYVECSTPNGQGQTQQCIDAEITGYPTWVFKDGSREDGELSFEKLAEKTSCPMPQ